MDRERSLVKRRWIEEAVICEILQILPEELLIYLLRFFDTVELLKLRILNKSFKEIIEKSIRELVIKGSYRKMRPLFLSNLTNLTALDISQNKSFQDIDIGAMTHLKRLVLQSRPVGPWILSLTRLEDLVSYSIRDEYISQLTRLKFLDISRNIHVTDAGLQPLTNLKSLALWKNDNITIKGITNMTGLQGLDLSENDCIFDDDLKQFQELTTLELVGNEVISNESVRYLTNLTALNASGSLINDDGVLHLTNLTCLIIQSDNITDRSVSNLTNLTRLDITNNSRVTDRGLSQLVKLRDLHVHEGISSTALRMMDGLMGPLTQPSLFLIAYEF